MTKTGTSCASHWGIILHSRPALETLNLCNTTASHDDNSLLVDDDVRSLSSVRKACRTRALVVEMLRVNAVMKYRTVHSAV